MTRWAETESGKFVLQNSKSFRLPMTHSQPQGPCQTPHELSKQGNSIPPLSKSFRSWGKSSTIIENCQLANSSGAQDS